ncbi:hypothetical protein O6H91_Y453400 [Diphasiastrum complanatum]|nr:hypothetical protein O6H91_Y453400 [Diphasiastrum complanatum]
MQVENLFYNVIARKKAFKNPSEEYSRILDVISRYAIQKIGVSFSCKKHGDSRTDIHTDSTSSRTDAIRAVYGPGVARELVSVTASDDDPSHSIFKMDGYISSANYSAKKTTMVLFINDRLVECSSLKKAIEVVYAAILPKASKPFLYISIAMPPEHVDINIHPTKREVSFLNQESLIDSIQKAIEAKLMQSNTTRTFYTQTLLSRSLGVPDEAEESMPVQTQGQAHLSSIYSIYRLFATPEGILSRILIRCECTHFSYPIIVAQVFAHPQHLSVFNRLDAGSYHQRHRPRAPYCLDLGYTPTG